MNMLTLAKEDLFMLLDRWNGSTARKMTDPRLLQVHRELKPRYVFPPSFESGLVYIHPVPY